jgi:type IV pilus assembly protein PilM
MLNAKTRISLPRPKLALPSLPKRAPRKPASGNGCVGLDIDGDAIAAVEVRDGRVANAVSTGLPEGILRDGEVADVDGLAEVLKEFFKRESLPREVRLGVANAQIQVRHLELPPIADEKERDAAVRFQAEEAIAMPIDETVIDYSPLGAGTTLDGTPTERYVLVAARRTMIDGFVNAASAAGLKPAGIDLNAFALVRALAAGAADDEMPRAYLHLGGVSQVAIAAGETCLFTRALAAGSGTEVHALADEVRMSIDYYRGQPGSVPVDELRLSGAGAPAVDAAVLGERLGMAVVEADPLGPLPTKNFPLGEDPQRHTIALGLALGAAA